MPTEIGQGPIDGGIVWDIKSATRPLDALPPAAVSASCCRNSCPPDFSPAASRGEHEHTSRRSAFRPGASRGGDGAPASGCAGLDPLQCRDGPAHWRKHHARSPAAARRHGRLALRQPHRRAALSPARHRGVGADRGRTHPFAAAGVRADHDLRLAIGRIRRDRRTAEALSGQPGIVRDDARPVEHARAFAALPGRRGRQRSGVRGDTQPAPSRLPCMRPYSRRSTAAATA